MVELHGKMGILSIEKCREAFFKTLSIAGEDAVCETHDVRSSVFPNL